jgi:hypothetical protein
MNGAVFQTGDADSVFRPLEAEDAVDTSNIPPEVEDSFDISHRQGVDDLEPHERYITIDQI